MNAAAEYPANPDDTSRDEREFGRPQESAESQAPVSSDEPQPVDEPADEQATQETEKVDGEQAGGEQERPA